MQFCRLLYYGYYFSRECEKQEMATKRQCVRMNQAHLQRFLENDQVSARLHMALKSTTSLLQQLVHTDMVPKVFGIRFDKLFVRALIGVVLGAVFSFVSYILRSEVVG